MELPPFTQRKDRCMQTNTIYPQEQAPMHLHLLAEVDYFHLFAETIPAYMHTHPGSSADPSVFTQTSGRRPADKQCLYSATDACVSL